jgi:hypothetical protein
MKMQFAMAALAAAFLGCGSTQAQVGGVGTSPLSATSRMVKKLKRPRTSQLGGVGSSS